MSTIQKATFAASALAITLVGSVLVTAPMLFARPVPIVAHAACSTSSRQLTLVARASCDGVGRDSPLLALNRR